MRASFILPLLTLLTPIFAAPSTTATTSASTSVTSLPSIPPACLLHAVNTQNEPADLKAVCGNGVSEVQSYLADNCGQHADVAQAVFIDRCEKVGSSVAAYTATSSSDSSSQTGTITAGANGSTTSSGARGGAAVSTAGANNEYQRVARGPMAAAAIALVGAVAAL